MNHQWRRSITTTILSNSNSNVFVSIELPISFQTKFAYGVTRLSDNYGWGESTISMDTNITHFQLYLFGSNVTPSVSCTYIAIGI